MYFLAPEFLWLLLIVPGLVLLYLWLMRRKKKLALRYASLAIVRQAMAGDPSWRRHLPPALLLVAIGLALLLPGANPQHGRRVGIVLRRAAEAIHQAGGGERYRCLG